MKLFFILIVLSLSVLNAKISDTQLKKMIGHMIIVGFEDSSVNKNSEIIKQINEYETFIDKGKAKYGTDKKKPTNAPKDYTQIRVHLVFDVKHDGRHKARLVADGHLTSLPVESVY